MSRPRRSKIARFSWALPILLALTLAQLASGFLGLISGSEDFRWALWLHGIGAYGIIVVSFWKGNIISESLGRRRRLRLALLGSIALAVLLAATVLTGLLWTFAGRRHVANYSLVTIHIGLAGGLILLLPWHVLGKRWVFRDRNAMARRNFLRLGGMALAGAALGLFAGRAMEFLDLPGSKRRFTGSYETGSLTGEFPVVTWLFDYPAPIDVRNWRLIIDGAVERPLVMTYEQLNELGDDVLVGIIDCTGGWYSRQEWQGVNVGRLLEMSGVKVTAQSVSFEAVSGYGRRFSVDEASGYLLALRVAGTRLDHGHGFPVRLVAPEHRGFEWVKWLARIRVNETSKFLQPPVPLQ